MACRIDREVDGCTFQWKIENISHCWWLKTEECIVSPVFIADAVQGTKWSLLLYPMGNEYKHMVGLYLNREYDCSGSDEIQVNYQLAILDKNGSLFKEVSDTDIFVKDDSWGHGDFISWERIFVTEKEALLPEDTLTVQCTIWNKEEKPIKSKHFYVRTIFIANRRSLEWKIEKFSSRDFASRKKLKDDLVDLDLVLNEKPDFEKEIIIIMNAFDDFITYFSLKTSIIDSEGKKENCGMKEYLSDNLRNKGELSFMLDFPKTFMEDKSLYLPNDVLCLNCEFVLTTETVRQDNFGNGIISTELNGTSENINEYCIGKEKSQNIAVLTDDLKAMYIEGILSDMELRTSTQTFPAHRNILSARSLVFRRMFSNDMKEKNSGHVDITDLDDDTVKRMLLYIYTDSLEDLQFESACKLYDAADKYDILSLKNKCSSFFEDNLCLTKACDVLILADQHQDNDLKSAVQDYILDRDEMFSSQEWIHFMDTNIKLAADIMYRKINPGKIRSCNM